MTRLPNPPFAPLCTRGGYGFGGHRGRIPFHLRASLCMSQVPSLGIIIIIILIISLYYALLCLLARTRCPAPNGLTRPSAGAAPCPPLVGVRTTTSCTPSLAPFESTYRKAPNSRSPSSPTAPRFRPPSAARTAITNLSRPPLPPTPHPPLSSFAERRRGPVPNQRSSAPPCACASPPLLAPFPPPTLDRFAFLY